MAGHFAGAMPAAPVHDIEHALTANVMSQENRLWAYPHPQRPDFRMVPLHPACQERRCPAAPAAAIGADTDAVLRDISDTESGS